MSKGRKRGKRKRAKVAEAAVPAPVENSRVDEEAVVREALARQLERRSAAVRAVQAEIDERGRVSFAALQRSAVETSIWYLLQGDAAGGDAKLRTDLYQLSNRALGEAIKAGRHMAKDDYAKIMEAQERRAGARSAFEAARASRKVVN